MTNHKSYVSPTFVEVGDRRMRRRFRSAKPPPALSFYNAMAVAQYSPTFIGTS